VALASGVGFVADGDAGLRVIGYQATDVAGQGPTVSIEALVLDVDPLAPGLQVIEGQTILVAADTADDADVRQVELLVNGVVAGRDTSFPHEALIRAGAAGTAMAVQARATDVGGNTGFSNVVALDVVADTFAPEIIAIDPAAGAILPEGLQRVRVRFSEALAAATVTEATFRVVAGGALVVAPLSIEVLAEGRLVELRYTGLEAGDYQIAIAGTAVTDRVGNALAAHDVISAFTLTGEAIEWINPAGGFWDDPASWEGGVLPGPDDNVLIDVPGDILIVHRTGETRINRLISRESIDLTGGTLDVTTTVQVDGTFNLGNGAVLAHATVVRGGGPFSPGVGGFATFDGVTLATEVRVVEGGFLLVENGLTLDRGQVTLDGAGTGATIHFAETQTLSGRGEIVFAGATDRNFVTMGMLTVGPDVLIHGPQGGRVGGGFTGETMILQGTIAAPTGGETVEVRVTSWTNEGLLLADGGGELALGGTFALAGSGAIDGANGTVSLVGTLDLGGGGLSVDGATGSLTLADPAARIRNGRIAVADGVKLMVSQGTFDAITLASNLTIPGGGGLTVRNGLTLDGAVITLLDDVPFTDPALAFAGTQGLGGAGEIVFGGAFDGSRVTASSGSTLTIGPGIAIHGTRGGLVGVLGAVVNQGTITADTSGREIAVAGSSVLNQGTMRAVNGGFMLTQAFANAGAVEVGAAGSSFRVLSGDLVQTGGSTAIAGGTVRANTVDIQGGSLTGFGTIVGNVRNAGALSPGNAADPTGTLTVQGGYQQTASGVLNVDLGGTAVANHDRLALTTAAGVATLAGTLNVTLADGFTPAVTQTFDVLTFSSRLGSFDTIAGLDLGGGLQLQPAFDPVAAPTRLRLTVVSA
jgi:hypothetical protein